jgi:nucleotide-binding universal stress UspA family protein
MYKKIAVALDGSALAECVLPHVKAIAKGCGTPKVVLLRIVEPLPTWVAPGVDLDAVQDANVKTAEEYLGKIQAELSKEGLDVEAKVLVGRAAEGICEFTEHNNVDLVAIATHGRSGISRWLVGTVAERLLRRCSAPILLIRPKGFESRI